MYIETKINLFSFTCKTYLLLKETAFQNKCFEDVPLM